MEHTQIGDPDITHLTFTQKSKCGRRMVKVSPQVPYTLKVISVKKKKNDDSSVLLKKDTKKRRKLKKRKKKDIYDIKKEKREEPEDECSSSIPLLLTTKAHGSYTLVVCAA